ncbi:intraflagellar transport protein 46 [Aphelenchoides avenae]|nr:intraflagellar transport protein 46 [Aphelenchus avenae]
MDGDGALPEEAAARRASQLRVIGEPISDESDDGLGEHRFGTTTTTSRVFAFGDDQSSKEVPILEVRPETGADDVVPFNEQREPEDPLNLSGSNFSTNSQSNLGIRRSDRPLSGKQSITDALEDDETLQDFEEREREITRQLSEEQERRASFSKAGSGDNELPYIPSSVQNRQSSLLDIRQESEAESDDSEYPEAVKDLGYPAEYPKEPPPAYSSPKESPRLVHESFQKSTALHDDGRGYEVPSPTPARALKTSASEEEEGVGTSASILHGALGGSVVLAGEDAMLKVAEEFRFLGGMAAAVAGAKPTNTTYTSTIAQPDDGSSSSDDQDLDAYIDNIRDRTPQARPSTGVGPLNRRSAAPSRPPVDTAASTDEPPPEPEIRYPITNELKEMFQRIEEFQAERIELEPKLKPFLLDYIPAVGDVDPFIKIPRPDEVDDNLGLTVLDEPAATQSDPAIIDLKLHQMSKIFSSGDDVPVKKLHRADKNSQQVDNWIQNIKELRRSKPPDRVHYSKPMPDIEKLLQEWNPEMEAALQTLKLPTAKLDASLDEYVDLCLSIADIPVQNNRIHALHLLFSLYAEFKNSQHFRNLAANNLYDGAPSETNRLEL